MVLMQIYKKGDAAAIMLAVNGNCLMALINVNLNRWLGDSCQLKGGSKKKISLN